MRSTEIYTISAGVLDRIVADTRLCLRVVPLVALFSGVLTP
jgi:hypothetical protein